MGISTKTLHAERVALQKSFNDLNTKIQTIDKEVQVMRNNLNAIHGALQQIEKLIDIDAQVGMGGPDKPVTGKKTELEIKEKKEAELLNESEKWKKISTIF